MSGSFSSSVTGTTSWWRINERCLSCFPYGGGSGDGSGPGRGRIPVGVAPWDEPASTTRAKDAMMTEPSSVESRGPPLLRRRRGGRRRSRVGGVLWPRGGAASAPACTTTLEGLPGRGRAGEHRVREPGRRGRPPPRGGGARPRARAAGSTCCCRPAGSVQQICSGRVTVLGQLAGSVALRRLVGYVTQAPSVYGDLTVRANARYFATVYGADETAAEAAVSDVGLAAGPTSTPTPCRAANWPGSRSPAPSRRAAAVSARRTDRRARPRLAPICGPSSTGSLTAASPCWCPVT